MTDRDTSPARTSGSGRHRYRDPFTAGDEMLARARDVSRRAAARLRELSWDDTAGDRIPLRAEPEGEQPVA